MDVGELLDNENCKRRKRLIDKLVEEYCENIDRNEVIYNGNLNDYENLCNSCAIYIILFVIFLKTNISISSAFIYFHWYLKRINTNAVTNINANT